MHAADRFPVFDMGEVHAGPDDVFPCSAGFRKGIFSNGEDASCLAGGVFFVGADGPRSGHMDCVAHAHSREKPMMGSKGDPPLMFWRMEIQGSNVRVRDQGALTTEL